MYFLKLIHVHLNSQERVIILFSRMSVQVDPCSMGQNLGFWLSFSLVF